MSGMRNVLTYSLEILSLIVALQLASMKNADAAGEECKYDEIVKYYEARTNSRISTDFMSGVVRRFISPIKIWYPPENEVKIGAIVNDFVRQAKLRSGVDIESGDARQANIIILVAKSSKDLLSRHLNVVKNISAFKLSYDNIMSAPDRMQCASFKSQFIGSFVAGLIVVREEQNVPAYSRCINDSLIGLLGLDNDNKESDDALKESIIKNEIYNIVDKDWIALRLLYSGLFAMNETYYRPDKDVLCKAATNR